MVESLRSLVVVRAARVLCPEPAVVCAGADLVTRALGISRVSVFVLIVLLARDVGVVSFRSGRGRCGVSVSGRRCSGLSQTLI